MAGPHEVRGRCEIKDSGGVGLQADVLIVSVVSNSAVYLNKRSADGFCAVSGRVIADDEFKVVERLNQKRVNCVSKETLSIPHGQADTDSRGVHPSRSHGSLV